jgi:glutaredoxin-related protein
MSRLDRLKEQHKDLNVNLIDLLATADPSGTYKYLPFLIKVFKSTFATNGDILRHLVGQDNIASLVKFEEHLKANRIKNNDIGLYTNFKQIKDANREADEVVRLKELEKQVKKIHEDNEWLILIPLSYESARMYGANTKWCITQEEYWRKYKINYKIIYIISKQNDVKYAISVKDDDGLVEGWKANDDSISPFMMPIPQNVWLTVIPEIQKLESIVSMDEYRNLDVSVNAKKIMSLDYNDYRTYIPVELQNDYPITQTRTNDDDDYLFDGADEDEDEDSNTGQLRTYQDINTDNIKNLNLNDISDIMNAFGYLGLGGKTRR